MRAAGRSICAIAGALQRAKSTVSRELRRNALPSGRYSPLHAGALVFTPIIKNSGNTPTKDLEIISIPTPEDNFIVMDEATRSQNYSVAVTTALKNGHRLNAPADPARLFSMGTVRPIRRYKALIGPKDE